MPMPPRGSNILSHSCSFIPQSEGFVKAFLRVNSDEVGEVLGEFRPCWFRQVGRCLQSWKAGSHMGRKKLALEF